MKIRNGFVSNSSSSSFLVFFPKPLTSKEEVYKALWEDNPSKETIKNDNTFSDTEKEEGTKNWRSYFALNMTFDKFLESAAETVWKDIDNQGPNNFLFALNEIWGIGYYDDDQLTLGIDEDDENFKGRYKTLEDLYTDIEVYTEMARKKDNFDWENGTDEEYEKLERFVDNYEYLFGGLEERIVEIKEYINEHKNWVFYSFQYSDESGTYFSILEHGGIFNKFPCYVESHH